MERILIVDDDRVLRERLSRALAERGFEVAAAADATEARQIVARWPPDRAVLDLRMPGGNGLELMRDLLVARPGLPCLILTGYGSIATAVDALRLGAVNVLQKPADADDVLAGFARAKAPPLSTADPRPLAAPSLARAEWEHIQRVMADCGGNVSEAARRLGLHRRSLQRKLQKRPPAA